MSEAPAAQMRKPARRSSGVVVPRRLHWYHYVLARLIAAGGHALAATWRLRLIDAHGVLKTPRGPMIFALWHNRLALSMTIWERWVRKRIPAAGLVALISASHDGGILSRALGYFDVEAVRGSSSRRGPQALLELTSWIERGYHVAITPDGPRGPCYAAQGGIIALAQVTGVPIVPVSTRVRGKLRLRSWDRFQVPLPFASGEVYVGELLSVPREADEKSRGNLRAELERRMRALTVD